MMTKKKPFAALFVLLLLSACTQSPTSTRQPEMTFANLTPLKLNVASVEVRNDYKPPMKAPNVEHAFPVPPYLAAENLLKQQLTAAGGARVLRAVIREASVMREELPLTQGFWGVLTHEPAERLKGVLVVRLEMADPAAPDIVTGSAEVRAERTKTLMEGLSAADRDSAGYALTEDLMRDLNKGLTEVVEKSFR